MTGWLGLVAAVLARPTLYTGGPIHTVDASDRVVEAMLIEDERVVAVGTEEALRQQAPDARIVDLAGQAIVPGFIDAHGHFPGEGAGVVFADLSSPPIGEIRTMAALQDRLREEAAQRRRGRWVVGYGYDDTLLPEGRHPTRHDLDQVSDRHPVAAIHISGHVTAINTAGLAALGITADTPDPDGGHILREADGRTPSGVLEELASEHAQRALLPGSWAGLRILREAERRYLAAGVTTAQSGLTPSSLVRSLAWLGRLRGLTLRLVIWPDEHTADALLAETLRLPRLDPDRVSLGAVKLLADGSIQSHTAHLREPYHDREDGHRGQPRGAPAVLAEKAARYHAAGLQLAIHGNGDAAIDTILDAIAAAQHAHPRDDARHIIIHAQLADAGQLDRMQELAVTPSFFVQHIRYWGDRHRTIFLGEERAARLDPIQSAWQRELRPTLHADSPVVPIRPLEMIEVAVSRTTRTGVVLGADERLSPAQALRSLTIEAAWQQHLDTHRGSLEPGKLADFVVLSASPLQPGTTVQQTIIGGRVVYRAEQEPSRDGTR